MDSLIETKTCSKCNTTKTTANFARRSGGFESCCRECLNEYQRQYQRQYRKLRGLIPKPPKRCGRCGADKPHQDFRKTSRFPNADACADCRELPLPGEESKTCAGCLKLKPLSLFPAMSSGVRRRRCEKCERAKYKESDEARAIRLLCQIDEQLPEHEPWNRLGAPGEGCQRFFDDSEVRECGAVPAQPVAFSDGNLKMRLCGGCEKEEAAIWQVQRLDDGSKVGFAAGILSLTCMAQRHTIISVAERGEDAENNDLANGSRERGTCKRGQENRSDAIGSYQAADRRGASGQRLEPHD